MSSTNKDSKLVEILKKNGVRHGIPLDNLIDKIKKIEDNISSRTKARSKQGTPPGLIENQPKENFVKYKQQQEDIITALRKQPLKDSASTCHTLKQLSPAYKVSISSAKSSKNENQTFEFNKKKEIKPAPNDPLKMYLKNNAKYQNTQPFPLAKSSSTIENKDLLKQFLLSNQKKV